MGKAMLSPMIVLWALLGITWTRPRLAFPSANDHDNPRKFRIIRSTNLPPNFKTKYVFADGTIRDKKDCSKLSIEVAASPLSSPKALQVAAETVSKMLKCIPTDMFERLARKKGRVGVFTRMEATSIYPEYLINRRPPNCTDCLGRCRNSCTADGRIRDKLAGLGGIRATIVEDNLLCSKDDEYYHHNNILVHEFAHTIQRFSFDTALYEKLVAAYAGAKQNQTWRQSYAMRDIQEYWAEASGSFFLVNKYGASGGLNECGNQNGYCPDEKSARDYIRKRDPDLYAILARVYTCRKRYVPSNLTICPPQA